MQKYVYVTSYYSDGRVSHTDKWQCFSICGTCRKRFICYTRYEINYDEWNFGREFPFMSYEGIVRNNMLRRVG